MYRKLTYEYCTEVARGCETSGQLKRKDSTIYCKALKEGWFKKWDWLSPSSSRKLTYEYCLEVARDCETRGQLKRKDASAYNKARTEGWLKKWSWLRCSRELTYEYCTEVARDCETREQLESKDNSVYKKALKEGWLKKWSWLRQPVRDYSSLTKWTEEVIRETASKYEHLSDFKRENINCYFAAFRKGIVRDLGLKFNERLCRRNGGGAYWTRELVQEKANECIKEGMCLFDFKKKYPGAYNRAYKEGYLQELGFGRKVTIYNGKDNVYSYEFKDGSVYIGRTIRLTERDWEHRNKEIDTVFIYSKQSGLEIPKVKILKIVDNVNEGLFWEDWYLKDYKEKGWNILNKGKTGIKSGSLGGGRYLWTDKSLKKLVKERNFKNPYQMQREEGGAYRVAKKIGILDELFPNKQKNRPVYKVEGYKYTFYDSVMNCAKMNEGFNYGRIYHALSENRKYKGKTIRYLNIKEQE